MQTRNCGGLLHLAHVPTKPPVGAVDTSSLAVLSAVQPGMRHAHIRHGTTTLSSALDVAAGSAIAECKPWHRDQEFLSFLRRIEKEVPSELNVHLIVDN